MGKRLGGNGAKGRRIPRKSVCLRCRGHHIALTCMFKTPELLTLQTKRSYHQRSGKLHQLEDVLSTFDADAGENIASCFA